MRWLMKIIGAAFVCVTICLLVSCCRYERLNQQYEEVIQEAAKVTQPEDDGIVRKEPTNKAKAMRRNVNPDPDTFGTLTEEERKA